MSDGLPSGTMENATIEPCRACARRSDWEFLKEFYHREEHSRQQVLELNHHVTQLSGALHHAGLTSQNDRIALNKAHAHLKELQAGYSQSEASRARFENGLHEERQEHRMCQEALNHERIRHSETEKNLNCVWNAHTRLGEIISKVPYQVTASGEEKTGDSIDITELVLELEAKASKIQGLEDALIHQQEQSHSDLLLIEGRLHERSVQHQEEVTAKTETINELESQLRRGRLEVDAEDTGPEAKVPKRAGRKWKRTRGKGRACKGVSTEEAVGKQSLSDPLESSGETFVETFKEEVVQ